MSTTTNPEQARTGKATAVRPTTEQIWRAVAKASFAVVSHVTPTGQPRASGVVYTTIDRRLYVVVAVDSWKARHIAASGRVAVTVPVRRGGLMSLLFPIPPATISFPASAVVHSPDSPEGQRVLNQLAKLLPPEQRDSIRIIEIRPEGRFVTYGVGVPLLRMRNPALARAHVPVA